MSYNNKDSRIPTIILWGIVTLTTLGMIAAIVFGVVRMKHKNDPAESTAPIGATEPDTVTPNTEIPVIIPGTEQGGEEATPPDETTEPGHISVDIIEANKENEKEDQPHIVGDVSILPGVKEVGNETSN